MTHSLSEIDEQARTGICSVCGPTKIKLRDKKRSTLNGRYKCKVVYKKSRNKLLYPYSVHKKDICQQCGFNPVHTSQLDVDHIDGDRWNNDPFNLQTLCANCHRLKTHLNGDANSGKF
jgi:hypothetical protein